MASYTIPLWLCPSRFELERVSFGFSSRSQVSGKAQVRPTLGWFWRATISYPAATMVERARSEGFWHGVGVGDTVAMGHPVRRVPRGTQRGTPTVSGAHAAGVRDVDLLGTNGATLLAGDLIKMGGCLYMLRDNVTFGAAATSVPLAGGLLTSLTDSDAVYWDQPTIDWIRVSIPRISYVPGLSPEIVVDLEESR